jgi:hypothetical protein
MFVKQASPVKEKCGKHGDGLNESRMAGFSEFFAQKKAGRTNSPGYKRKWKHSIIYCNVLLKP